jgi:hypothetical protein
MDEKKDKKEIPLDALKDKLPQFDAKKEEYRLRHYLAYHVVKKSSKQRDFKVEHEPVKISFD